LRNWQNDIRLFVLLDSSMLPTMAPTFFNGHPVYIYIYIYLCIKNLFLLFQIFILKKVKNCFLINFSFFFYWYLACIYKNYLWKKKHISTHLVYNFVYFYMKNFLAGFSLSLSLSFCFSFFSFRVLRGHLMGWLCIRGPCCNQSGPSWFFKM